MSQVNDIVTELVFTLNAVIGLSKSGTVSNIASTPAPNTSKNSETTPLTNANATTIFGPNRNVLRGKAVRRRPERVEADFIQIPRDYYVLHKFVTLTADLMFVSGIPFLVTLSRGIRLYTASGGATSAPSSLKQLN